MPATSSDVTHRPHIDFRSCTSADHEFLARVYASTRWEELAATGWSEQQIGAFLREQFEFQTADWNQRYSAAQRSIVLVDGQPAGRLYLHRSEADRDLRVVDIALLPEFRSRGVATRIFSDLFNEADERRWRVSIHVEQNNPAKRLYVRLGFEPAHLHGIYLLMTRPARTAAPVSSSS